MKSDLISRQDAIDALDCINGTEEVLRSLSSAQPEYTEQDVRDSFNSGYACGMEAAKKGTAWIQCSKKLPKEDEYVLICFEDDPKEKWYCRMAVGWLEDGFWQCWDDRANTRKDVVAWMPLPEPYKGGEEHETD